MKLKRFISLMISVSVFLGMLTYVHADTDADVLAVTNEQRTKVTVTADVGNAEGLLTVITVTKSGNLDDAALVFLTYTKEDGAVAETAILPESLGSDTYQVIVSNSGGKKTGEFVFSKIDDIKEVMGLMNAIKAGDYDSETDYINAVKTVISENSGKLSLNATKQAGLFGELGEAFAICKKNKVYTDYTVFMSEFNQCLAAVILNNGGDVKSTLDKYSLEIGKEVAALDTYPKEVKDLVFEDLKTIDYEKGLLSKQLPEMRVVAFFKISDTWGSAKLNILGQDKDGKTYVDNFKVLAPDTTYYNELISVNDVYVDLFENINSINTIDELRESFEKFALAEYESQEAPQGGGTSPNRTPTGNKGIINNYKDKTDDTKKEEASSKNEVLSDIKNHWAETQIRNLYNKNVVSGYSDGTFKPQDNVSRAEFVKMIVSIGFDEFANADNKFLDVKENDWHYNYIMTAYANGIVNGTSEDTFSPNTQITRQDASVIIYNYLKPKFEVKASGYPDDANISEYAKDAVYALTELGIVTGYDTGNFEPKNNLTRAESAVLLSRILNVSQSDLDGYVSAEEQKKAAEKAAEADFRRGVLTAANSNFSIDMNEETVSRGKFLTSLVGLLGKTASDAKVTFTDVSQDSECYSSVAYALERGWLSEGDTFSPDAPATFDFAVELGVNAIGAHDYAANVGYENVAQLNDFYEDIDAEDRGIFSPEVACTLLYNIINSPTCVIDGTSSGNLNGQPILEQIHELYIYEGIFSANKRTDIENEKVNSRRTLRIGEYEFYCDADYDEYLGQNVRVLYEIDDKELLIRFMSPYKNSIAQFNNHTFDDVRGSKVYYEENGRSKNFTLDSKYLYILNGKATLITSPNFNELFSKETTNYKVIDNDNDDKYDVIFAESYIYTYVDKFDSYSKVIYDKFSSAGYIDLSDEECEYVVYLLKDGVLTEGTLDDIKVDSLIAHCASDDNKYYKLIVCQDTAEGQITVSRTEGNNEIVSIDDANYYKSQYYIDNYVSDLGQNFIYYIGINNEIVVEELAENVQKYAWLIKIYPKDLEFVDDENPLYLKLFTQDDEVVSLPVAKKVMYDGVSSETEDTLASLNNITEDKDRIIKYRLNADGEVIMIDTAESRPDDVTTFGQNYPVNNSLSHNYSGRFASRSRLLLYDLDKKIATYNFGNTKFFFLIPELDLRDDDNEYRLIKSTDFPRSGNYEHGMHLYDTALSGSPAAIAITSSQTLYGAGGGTSQYAVVGDIFKSLNDDGEVAFEISVNNGKTFNTIYMDEYTMAKYPTLPDKGDIIKYTTDSKGNVKSIGEVFDLLKYNITPADDTEKNSGITFTQGFVYSYSDGFMYYFAPEMKTEYIPTCENVEPTGLVNVDLTENQLTFIDVVRSSDGSEIKSVDVKLGPVTNLSGYKNTDPEDVTYVVVRNEYNYNQATFAYRISYE